MVFPGLDYLSSPTGPIKEAQALAARAFGADRTWFLVNGTTVGIQAAIMATCGPADTLILARNCHMAAFSGMVMAGCRPSYMHPGMLAASLSCCHALHALNIAVLGAFLVECLSRTAEVIATSPKKRVCWRVQLRTMSWH